MILYIGTFSLLNAISMVLYFFGLSAIPNKVRSGERKYTKEAIRVSDGL